VAQGAQIDIVPRAQQEHDDAVRVLREQLDGVAGDPAVECVVVAVMRTERIDVHYSKGMTLAQKVGMLEIAKSELLRDSEIE
jgi:hypothetical protein